MIMDNIDFDNAQMYLAIELIVLGFTEENAHKIVNEYIDVLKKNNITTLDHANEFDHKLENFLDKVLTKEEYQENINTICL